MITLLPAILKPVRLPVALLRPHLLLPTAFLCAEMDVTALSLIVLSSTTFPADSVSSAEIRVRVDASSLILEMLPEW